MLEQGCHFDECARRNLIKLTDLSYRRDDKNYELSLVRWRDVLLQKDFSSFLVEMTKEASCETDSSLRY